MQYNTQTSNPETAKTYKTQLQSVQCPKLQNPPKPHSSHSSVFSAFDGTRNNATVTALFLVPSIALETMLQSQHCTRHPPWSSMA